MKSCISNEIASLISEQIKKEYESSYLYLQFADYYEKNGLPGFAAWFTIQAREEADHALIFLQYLHETNTEVKFYPIQPSALNIKSIREPLEMSLKHEKFVTESINKIFKKADSENDFRTKLFLSWFITEQFEEEINAQNLLDSYDLFVNGNCNKDSECHCKSALLEMDRKYGERKYTPSSKLSA